MFNYRINSELFQIEHSLSGPAHLPLHKYGLFFSVEL